MTAPLQPHSQTCPNCGKEFQAVRSNRLYCQSTCYQSAFKARLAREYRAVYDKRPDPAAVRRCIDAIRDGAPRKELERRFGGPVFRLAMENRGERA